MQPQDCAGGAVGRPQELKRIYSYLLVLGYAVKYYLNEQAVIKPYDEEIKGKRIVTTNGPS
jgi:hypothetical protein